ncbi:hypothetical protein FSP39_023893 [Pinctada imbricata]|uniref:Uncharacterized protein n=1 Tax=Pinctada imbricata TaxID=66713 RepID=A0AA88Y630_PINIB|nr:hypothetical protein FSP39_023893 [Pinctada imbricata]
MTTQDLINMAEELKRLLRICNYVSDQILHIDDYLLHLDQRSVQAALNGQEHFTRQFLVRRSVADGIKRRYEEQRDKVWRQVQKLSNQITRTTSGEFSDEDGTDISAPAEFPLNFTVRSNVDKLASPETSLFSIRYRFC